MSDDEDDPHWNSRNFCFVALDGDRVVGSCLGQRPYDRMAGPRSGGQPERTAALPPPRHCTRPHVTRWASSTATARWKVNTDTDAAGFTGAYRLYEQLGMRIFRRTHTFEKEIRPGPRAAACLRRKSWRNKGEHRR